MINVFAYVYLWYDKRYYKFYLGYTNGKDKNYKGSGSEFLKEYKKRPEDFKQRIIAEGSENEMAQLEKKLLKIRKKYFGKRYYNKIISWPIKSHIKSILKIISEAKRKNWQDPEYKKKKLKSSLKSGKNNPSYGKEKTLEEKENLKKHYIKNEYKIHGAESRKKRSLAQRGRKLDRETRKWINP